jgi:hypothetical protein
VRPFAGSGTRRSWVNWAIDSIDGLPVPPWVTYTLLTLGAIAISNAQAFEASAIDQTPLALTYYGILTIAPLWFIHYLDRVARRSLDAFRPALDADEARLAAWREELTRIPARPAAALAAFGYATMLGYAAAPEAAGLSGLSPAGLVLRVLAEGLVAAFILVLLYHTLRQLRAVARIHAAATRLDLLRPAPLYAFSKLTSRTAIGIVLLLYSSVVIDPENWSGVDLVVILPWVVAPSIVAVAAFVLPLRGMHDRLAAEKERLMGANAMRLERASAALHDAVDAGDLSRTDGLSRMDGLNKALASLVAERDLLARLSTWPWQPGTVGAFVTAVALPIGLFLVTRILDRFV